MLWKTFVTEIFIKKGLGRKSSPRKFPKFLEKLFSKLALNGCCWEHLIIAIQLVDLESSSSGPTIPKNGFFDKRFPKFTLFPKWSWKLLEKH